MQARRAELASESGELAMAWARDYARGCVGLSRQLSPGRAMPDDLTGVDWQTSISGIDFLPVIAPYARQSK
jgi:hypothetical protein